MKTRMRTKNTVKIADVLVELGLSEAKLHHILCEVNVRLEEGQKNLDRQEVARARQYLNERRRREELKRQAIALPSITKVQGLAKALELPVGEVLSQLLKNGVTATLNDNLDYETAAIVAADLGYTTEERVEELEKDVLTSEKLEEVLKKEDPAKQEVRPPVITIMGHVDHGKTTLLDSIRSTNVAAGETGGITQAISSYQVKYKGRLITFIDTPGHETFEFMRRRGAGLADVAILVVAADDGVKLQTKEAVKYAQEAGVPIVVALNKIDKGMANVDKAKKELAEIGLNPEEWGGKTVIAPISALKKQGIDELLEMVLLTADINPPKAIPDRAALGSVVESKLDKNLGPLATVLIHTGTLKAGDNVVVGRTAGRVRRLLDFRNRPVQQAMPSMPVTIVGLNDVPAAGDTLQVVEAKVEARAKAGMSRAPIKKMNTVDKDDVRQVLALVIKAGSQGSLEALESTIRAMVPREVRLSIIRSDVGTVSDSDVLTAAAAKAIIYTFNAKVDGMSRKLADKEQVPIKSFDVIYRLTEDVRGEIEKRLPVEIVREDLGKLKVLKVFFSIQKRKIVGGEVAEGIVEVGAKVIVQRPSSAQPSLKLRPASGGKAKKTGVGYGVIMEMQRERQTITRAQQGDQIGITVKGKGKIKEGDVLLIYREEMVRQKLN